jgi:hypothetical protein
LYRQLPLDGADGAGDFVDLAVQRTPPTDDDAIALCLGGGGLPCAVDHLILRQEIVAVNRGRRYGGLRAVMAIFLTRPALGVLKHLKTNGLAEVTRPNGKGGVQQGQQLLVGRIQDVSAFRTGEGFIVERFAGVCCVIHHVGFLRG